MQTTSITASSRVAGTLRAGRASEPVDLPAGGAFLRAVGVRPGHCNGAPHAGRDVLEARAAHAAWTGRPQRRHGAEARRPVLARARALERDARRPREADGHAEAPERHGDDR